MSALEAFAYRRAIQIHVYFTLQRKMFGCKWATLSSGLSSANRSISTRSTITFRLHIYYCYQQPAWEIWKPTIHIRNTLDAFYTPHKSIMILPVGSSEVINLSVLSPSIKMFFKIIAKIYQAPRTYAGVASLNQVRSVSLHPSLRRLWMSKQVTYMECGHGIMW